MRGPVASVASVAVVAALLVAGCSSDGDGQGVGTDATGADATFATLPPVDDPITSTNGTPAGTDADATVSPTTSPTSGPVATTTSPPPVALVEPVVELVEVGRFDRPVEVVVRPLDTRLFVVEQTGRVRAVDDESDEVVLDISALVSNGSEQGLLGVAFHPNADLAYVNYTDRAGDTIVAEHAVDTETGVLDPSSAREVLKVDQPHSNHNGGQLAFGPDGMLYIGLGDGGSAGDPDRNGLDPTTPLGKILRIDPLATGSEPYSVPSDNPFVGVDGADPRIWSLGLRNPWRFSFDPVTGDLWIADVGQNDFEEIDHAPATDGLGAGRGLSFGWSAFEGNTAFNTDQPADGHTPPVYVYSQADGGCAVSGGVVARDTTVPDLSGWYVFGDYCTGEIWALDPSAPADAPRVVPLANLGGVAAISVGADGELYAVSNAGAIARFVAP